VAPRGGGGPGRVSALSEKAETDARHDRTGRLRRVSFDWKKAEQEDRERSNRRLLPMGIVNVTLGIAQIVLVLVSDDDDHLWWLGCLFVITGVAYLYAWWRNKRRANRDVSDPPSVE
jgi:hypothetical protein